LSADGFLTDTVSLINMEDHDSEYTQAFFLVVPTYDNTIEKSIRKEID